MTTKPPSAVRAGSEESQEAIAYACVQNIPTAEPHDQDRLGYNLWRWLTQRKDTLEMAVRSAGSRLLISEDEAIKRIRENLRQRGIAVD